MDLYIIRAICLLSIFCAIFCKTNAGEVPHGKRLYRSLPSVSRDHYSEILPDGTYKYAYTGQHRYVAERRLSDGTVEGESLYIRPDGVPIKVHYFADGKGYRPNTEVLYAERRNSAPSKIVVPVPDVRYRKVDSVLVRDSPVPTVLLAPKPNSVGVNIGDARTGEHVSFSNNGGDVAAALPSVTAIVGPGGHAEIRPEAIAKTGDSRYFRSGGGSGDVAIAKPSATAIVGPGASVVISPSAKAYSGGAQEEPNRYEPVVPIPTRVLRPQPVVAVPAARYVDRPVFVDRYVDRPVVVHQPVPVAVPAVTAVRAAGVVLVPPRPSYSYSYSYSAPDGKHPHRDNTAQVSVSVNGKKKK